MSSILRRLWLLITRSRYDRDLQEEIAFHVETRERELIAEGVPVGEARHRAQREFGNSLRIQEKSRSVVTFWWETLLQDLRFAFRMMKKSPGFTSVVVLSMAIGIGATTSIFSVLNAMVLRQLAVRAPGEMFLFSWSVPTGDFPDAILSSLEGNFVRDADGRYRSFSVSYPMYARFRARQTKFEDVFAFTANSEELNIGVAGRAFAGTYIGVSGNYFSVAGVAPVRGRLLF